MSDYDRYLLRMAEEHFMGRAHDMDRDGYVDPDAGECGHCGATMSLHSDATLESTGMCSDCWVAENLQELRRPGIDKHGRAVVDPLILCEFLDAVERMQGQELTMIETYRFHGLPVKVGGMWKI